VAGTAGNGKPVYPRIARRDGAQGTVLLRVMVSAQGRPVSVTIERSSGHALLDEAASSKVLNDWTFVPAMRGARPVEGFALIPVSFRLAD
jgi:protein TonB